MGNLSLPTLAERPARAADLPARRGAATPPELDLLVVSFGEATAADYADYVRRRRPEDCRVEVLERSDRPGVKRGPIRAIVLFLAPRLSERDRRALDELLNGAGECRTDFVGVVSSYRAHLGDRDAAEGEAQVLGRVKG